MRSSDWIMRSSDRPAADVRRRPNLPLYHTPQILSIGNLHKLSKNIFPEIVYFTQIEKTFKKPIDFFYWLWYNIYTVKGRGERNVLSKALPKWNTAY